MINRVDLEIALEMIADDLRRLEKAANALEANGNFQAAYDARSWRLAMGRLYKEVSDLLDAIEGERFLEASERACALSRRIYSMLSTALNSRYSFITSPSRRVLASLLTLASNYCGKG